ncbi:MAG: FMN-binding protein [Candidatus Auribacterota bacterium]|jgi:RnfABCDGE-type electron transport complex G subunit|nr:FMN-binding protein [Candidatus Auribacterota bacterium]
MKRNTMDFIKLGLLLCLICILAAGLLTILYSVTRERIEIQHQREIKESLPLVLPNAKSFSSMKHMDDIDYYEGLSDNFEVIGYALNGHTHGYQSMIEFIIGIDTKGNIKGLRILEQGETPGLGARITEIKSDESLWSFIKSFFVSSHHSKGKSIEPWFTAMFRGKEYSTLSVCKTGETHNAVEAITGATITSVAVADGVKNTITTFLQKVTAEK